MNSRAQHPSKNNQKAQKQIIDRPLVTWQHNLSGTNMHDSLANEIKTKGLKVGHININELKYLLQFVEFNIFAESEIHLSKELKEEQIKIEGYNISRGDRQCSGNNWE